MQITPFLMYTGAAEPALAFYAGLFPGSRLRSIERYGPGEAGAEGTVKLAELELAGLRLRAIDSPAVHTFTFTPAFSLFVDCDSTAHLEATFAALAEGGQVLMPVDDYGFSARFGWVQDRFGVSWQLNLP